LLNGIPERDLEQPFQGEKIDVFVAKRELQVAGKSLSRP
jgi:hypothetical protein